MKSFLKNNSLSIVLFALFFAFLLGESITGHRFYNQDQREHGQPIISYVEYLGTGEFIEGVFENWESEFLQMGSYVLLTAFLYQRGSAESKPLSEQKKDERKEKQATRDPDPHTPWPVRYGGLTRKLYHNSLSIVFTVLFLLAFGLHGYGGARAACEENQVHHEQCDSTLEFMSTSEFWYQSFQNWQSEFMVVFAIALLSIYLRQKSSPESKPVDAPHSKTGAA
ncbi:MAG TPA: DUF6766 family protein [Candidatus Limnocylindrales bacterium]|nr:DUF6766 family protein [Candidatus Limnocylindrales bacterium]